MRLTASDFHRYYRPSKCSLRVYLREQGVTAAAPSPYEEVLMRLGTRHEQTHLGTFPSFVDLRGGTEIEREHRTRDEVSRGAPVVYQGVLRATATLNGRTCEIVGEPDFLIQQAGGYGIRDSKISRRITEREHPEILRQMGLYGWLYEQTFQRPPVRLQVHAGDGVIVDVPYDGGAAALAGLGVIEGFKQAQAEPLSAVGWTKCGGCGFHGHCWPRAIAARDVALVVGIDQGLALALHRDGIRTMDEFVARFDETSLAAYQRPWGRRLRRVGQDAASILRMANCLATGREIVVSTPNVPALPNYVMFDVEGLPPHLDDLEKTYLWGLQVYGAMPGPYHGATAAFGEEGDREGWEGFLTNARATFDEYGDLPFVHWHHYERVHLDLYVRRHGDRDGVAARIHRNLLDLLPITQDAVALPLPSYSLKVIEEYVGFKRTQEEYGGQWAMAKYIEAVETEDAAERAAIMDAILAYNREDLAATWAVLQWLKSKGR